MGGPFVDEMAILLTSHPRQQMFWPPAMFSWSHCPFYFLMGYDHTDLENVDLSVIQPPIQDYFTTGHESGTLGHFRGELMQLQIGSKLLIDRGFKYMFKGAMDYGIWRWRNLRKILGLMRKCDIVMCGSSLIFAKLDKFHELLKDWNPNIKCGGAELWLYSQIRKFQPNVRYEKAPWWTDILGYVHIQGEYALNREITVIDTWRIGQLWGKETKHRDIVPGRGVWG